ncbi:G-type lectin S-receptor-like serine/threonine-protein kinase SD2-2 [Eucalyptus grandis]|uniref:G-type lectin S-receptor-like serine/threonine-protein kinase SD2-2 n=1 Tax=Eucalyptus grandis TaxID=71139 RepID=UPI00192EF0BF|nr:G-type lectin S-receptor-like serine/threonine-protein kinase SD2-2 [Eucalyptus grandis]
MSPPAIAPVAVLASLLLVLPVLAIDGPPPSSSGNATSSVGGNWVTELRAGPALRRTLEVRSAAEARYQMKKIAAVGPGASRDALPRGKKLETTRFVLLGNSTLQSENGTFRLGFFSTNGDSAWYLGIWYASTPTPTYVWVANRDRPAKNLTSSTLELTDTGQLAVRESGDFVLWQSGNTEMSSKVTFSDSGNLILWSREGKIAWQSFDYPTDTWLPGMNLTKDRVLVSWRSSSDPSPGHYSLRLDPDHYGAFQLVYDFGKVYWSTGNWTGEAFSGVPEMTIPYIYQFHFTDPFRPTASFGYSERSLDGALGPPLSRFQVHINGQLRQYTWTSQTESWNTFWSAPENQCRVYGLCGNLGFCSSRTLRSCECLSGFRPVDGEGWDSGDYSAGCHRGSEHICEKDDVFEEVGLMGFEGSAVVSISGSRRDCEKSCLGNCSCIGLSNNEKSNLCKNIYGSLLNLRNLSADATFEDLLYVRVQRGGIVKENISKSIVLVASIVGSIAILGFSVLILSIARNRREKGKGKEGDEEFQVLNLRVFTYKELHMATRGFSEKLGHGGFGGVFKGILPDSTPVAVKRLERQGGGEKEFRAEVCTIGNIQHVNLVRLRGFCSENSHRLLVYDYMPNGPLSAYLRRDGPNLSWEVRYSVAIGTARGIAYLHEECRDCILHCDIKPENILLDGDFSAKVSDFGLAKLVGRDFSRVLASMRGTWGYVAPEWISGVGITTKADVYSYGMTLLELIGGRRNVEVPPSAGGEGGAGEKWFFPPWAGRQIVEGNVAGVMDNRLCGAYNMEEAERVAMVAVWCIQDEEDARPTMGMVVKMLEGVVEIPVPPPPRLIQALVSGESFQGFREHSGIRMSAVGSFSGGNMEAASAASESSFGIVSSPANVDLPESSTNKVNRQV